jgi:hypothetical protein
MESKVANKITKDWQRELPKLGINRPMSLLRRVGPLLVGVSLEREFGSRYTPTFHVQFLGIQTPWQSNLWTPLRYESGPRSDLPQTIFSSEHEAKYKDAAQRLVQQAPLSIEGPISISEVVEAYRQDMKTPVGRAEIAQLYRDCIKLLACYGLADQARAMLDEIHGIAKDDDEYSRFGGRESFDREMLESIEQPQKVWDQVEESLLQLKIPPRVPVEDFVQ